MAPPIRQVRRPTCERERVRPRSRPTRASCEGTSPRGPPQRAPRVCEEESSCAKSGRRRALSLCVFSSLFPQFLWGVRSERTLAAPIALAGTREREKQRSPAWTTQGVQRTSILAAASTILISAFVGRKGAARGAYLPSCIDGLEARPSGIPGAATGLFTTRMISRGAFLGFYCGDQHQSSATVPKDRETYAMVVGPENIVPDPTNERHWLCFMNEPPMNSTPNIEPSYTFLYNGQGDPIAVACAMHATRDIDPGSELFWYYGSRYDELRTERGYTQPEFRSTLPSGDRQQPSNALGAGLPLDCFVSWEPRKLSMLGSVDYYETKTEAFAEKLSRT